MPRSRAAAQTLPTCWRCGVSCRVCARPPSRASWAPRVAPPRRGVSSSGRATRPRLRCLSRVCARRVPEVCLKFSVFSSVSQRVFDYSVLGEHAGACRAVDRRVACMHAGVLAPLLLSPQRRPLCGCCGRSTTRTSDSRPCPLKSARWVRLLARECRCRCVEKPAAARVQVRSLGHSAARRTRRSRGGSLGARSTSACRRGRAAPRPRCAAAAGVVERRRRRRRPRRMRGTEARRAGLWHGSCA